MFKQMTNIYQHQYVLTLCVRNSIKCKQNNICKYGNASQQEYGIGKLQYISIPVK